MTVATVRQTVTDAVAAVAGVENVMQEEPYGREPEDALAARSDNGRVHFWLVKASTLRTGGGAGYREPRRRIRVEGFIELNIDDASGQSSYTLATNLQASVEDAVSDPDLNVELLETLDVDAEIPVIATQVGDRSIDCHRIGLTAVILEVT